MKRERESERKREKEREREHTTTVARRQRLRETRAAAFAPGWWHDCDYHETSALPSLARWPPPSWRRDAWPRDREGERVRSAAVHTYTHTHIHTFPPVQRRHLSTSRSPRALVATSPLLPPPDGLSLSLSLSLFSREPRLPVCLP